MGMGTPWSGPFHLVRFPPLGLELWVCSILAGQSGQDPWWSKKPLHPPGTFGPLGLALRRAAWSEGILDMGLDLTGACLPTWGAMVAPVRLKRPPARFLFLQRSLPFGRPLRVDLETGLPG